MSSATKLILFDPSTQGRGGGNPMVILQVMEAINAGATAITTLEELNAFVAAPKGKAVVMLDPRVVDVQVIRQQAEASCLAVQHITLATVCQLMSQGLNGSQIVDRLGL